MRERKCLCGRTSGYYLTDGHNAIISGQYALPVGINNSSFGRAARGRGNHMGTNFTAFVIPRICKTIKKREENEPSKR